MKMIVRLGWLLCVSTLSLAFHFTNKESLDQISRDIARARQKQLDELEYHSQPLSPKQLEDLENIQQAIQ
jgi:hypothetical protein